MGFPPDPVTIRGICSHCLAPWTAGHICGPERSLWTREFKAAHRCHCNICWADHAHERRTHIASPVK